MAGETVLVAVFAILFAGAAFYFHRKAGAAEAGRVEAERALEGARARLEAAAMLQQERDEARVLLAAALADSARLGAERATLETARTHLEQALARRQEELTGAREALERTREEAAAIAQRLASLDAASAERERAAQALQEKLEAQFAQMAGQALGQSQQAFLALANETFQKHQAAAAGGVQALLTPVQEHVQKLSETVQNLDKARLQERGALSEQIAQLGLQMAKAESTTQKLVTALKAEPQTRGAWGEQTLRNVLEMAGLNPYLDYVEQETHAGDEQKKLRPDVIVNLPGGRRIVIDAKVALTAYIAAAEAADETLRANYLRQHAKQVREHVKRLSQKEYWRSIGDSADFVVMFVAGEHFLSAAVAEDPSLIGDAIQNNVIPATPTTLVALAKAVAFGWRQEDAARNAREVADTGRMLYEALFRLGEKLATLGGALEGAVKKYNDVLATAESGALANARKLKALGAGNDKEIAAAAALEQPVRALKRLAPPVEPEPGPSTRKRSAG